MGKRGPAPRPTALRVLGGNPSHRPLPLGEPKPKRTMPRCPSWLNGEARLEWQRQAPRLHGMGVLTEIDGSVLAMYCRCWSRWLQAEADVQGFMEATGRLDRFRVLVALRYGAATRQLAGELGLSPSARTRIYVEPGSLLEDDGLLS